MSDQKTDMNLWQRLALAQGKVEYIQKEKKPGMQYSIVSHDAVTSKVRPVLVDCGVHYHPVSMQYSQNGNRTEVALTMRFVNVDKPSEFIDVPSLGYGIDSQDKGPGKAISYAVKYALLKTLGLETGDDPDNDQDVTHEPEVPLPKKDQAARDIYAKIDAGLNQISKSKSATLDDLKSYWSAQWRHINGLHPDWAAELAKKKDSIKAAFDTISQKEPA